MHKNTRTYTHMKILNQNELQQDQYFICHQSDVDQRVTSHQKMQFVPDMD